MEELNDVIVQSTASKEYKLRDYKIHMCINCKHYASTYSMAEPYCTFTNESPLPYDTCDKWELRKFK